MGVSKVSDKDFEAEVLKSAEPVVVDFWAEWCGPCKMIAPALEEIAGNMNGKVKIVKLNVDENPATAAKSVPFRLVLPLRPGRNGIDRSCFHGRDRRLEEHRDSHLFQRKWPALEPAIWNEIRACVRPSPS